MRFGALQEPGLAGAVFHRCAGTCSPSRLWRRLIRTVGNGHPGAAARGRRRPTSVASRSRWMPAVTTPPADWSQPQITGKLCRVRAHRTFRVAGWSRCGTSRACIAAREVGLNEWALSGDWTVREDAAALNKTGGSITYRFHARDLHLVMGPATPGTSVKFRVLIDGQPPGAARGVDVDEQGYGTVTEQRMYHADPATGPDRGSAVRDRVFWPGRGGVRLRVRLTRRATANSISQRITGVSGLPGVGVGQVQSIRKQAKYNPRATAKPRQDKVPWPPLPKASPS